MKYSTNILINLTVNNPEISYRLRMMTNETPNYTIIGVDVSKLKLDIALDDKQVITVEN